MDKSAEKREARRLRLEERKRKIMEDPKFINFNNFIASLLSADTQSTESS
jgi:hypothetical protein